MLAPTRSRLTIFSFVTITTLLVLLFGFSDTFSSVSRDYAHKAQDYWDASFRPPSPPPPPPIPQIYNCDDPYRRPGYLHIDHDDYKKTRWIPYTDDFLDAEPPWYAQYPPPPHTDLYFNNTPPAASFLNHPSTPPEWMKLAVSEHQRRAKAVHVKDMKDAKAQDFLGERDAGAMRWLWGRRVLLVGDSVDRFMVQFFCEEFGLKSWEPAPRTTAVCEIPSLNFTLVQWHFAGSFTYRPDWWWMKDMHEVAFEERWAKVWAPTDAHVRGARGRPDLLMWQNGLWDQRAFWEAGEAHFNGSVDVMGTRERQLAWDEVRFVAARLQALLDRLHGEFGADVPAMFRAITIHRNSNATDANLYEIDRIARAVGERNGHEVFEWGRIETAMSMLYRDRTHTGKGPGSWLWGNMMLEYLARSAGQGDVERRPYFDSWEACHGDLVHWGGR